MESDTFTSVCESFKQVLMIFFENEASESQSGNNLERSGSEQFIGRVNKKPRVMLLPLTPPVAMLYVEEDDDFVEEIDGSGVELGSAAKEAYGLLKRAKQSVCLVYDVPF